MSSDRIARLLEDIRLLSEERFALVQALRALVLGLDASVSEEVKYGGFLFSAGKPFCGVFSYTHHVSLEFGAGASMPDPYQVLEGKGHSRRHIKLTSLADIDDKHPREYLAVAFEAAARI